jgi:hypothetical protein
LKQRFHLSEGSGKVLIALALVALLALPIVCLVPHHLTPSGAGMRTRQHSTELRQRAAAICAALGVPNATIGTPQFIVQDFRQRGLSGQRRLWLVDCQAGPHRYSVIFNDLSGNLQCLFSDGLTISSRAAARGNVVVNSPSQAVEGSVRRLKDLHMLPKGTLLTLAERPSCDRDGITWHLAWKVQRSATSAPYDVRMMLNGSDVTPMSVVNCSELGKLAVD